MDHITSSPMATLSRRSVAVRIGMFLLSALGCSSILAPAPALAAARRMPSTPAARKSKAQPKAQQPKARQPEAQQAKLPPDNLTPLNSGPGILVCEPVLKGTETGLGDFGAGCGRWLHLVVGGQPEFGKTPLWSHTDRARRELKKPDLRLTMEEAVHLPRILGITHVALGEITGSSQKATLTYRLWELPAKKAVGAPLVATGTDAEVVAALPKLATGLAQALGATSPRVPATVGENVDELRTLGGLPWAPVEATPQPQLDKIFSLARPARGASGGYKGPQLPAVGAMLHLIFAGDVEDALSTGMMAVGLPNVLPENALILAELGLQHVRSGDKGGAESLPSKELEAVLARFPNNHLYRMAASYYQQKARHWEEARKQAELAVRCSTKNPHARLTLGNVIYGAAHAIRKGRFINDITEQELAAVQALYDQWLPVIIRAVELDPQSPIAWKELSSAAAFQGDSELADVAYGKALQLDPKDRLVLAWGLDLYQPKWQPDPAKFAIIAELALKVADEWSAPERFNAAIDMHHGGRDDLAQRMLRTDEERALLKKHAENCPLTKGE